MPASIVTPVATRVKHALALRRVHAAVRRVHGPAEAPRSAHVVGLTLVRDAECFVADFLAHHRALGVPHFVFLDTGSTDGTVDRLVAERDVTVLRTELAFRAYEVYLRWYMIQRFAGADRWSLVIDVDECLDWPGSRTLSLAGLLAYMDSTQRNALAAYMLDLFPHGPLAESTARADHCWYDLGDISRRPYSPPGNDVPDARITHCRGGVRQRVFGTRPLLTKHPLLRASGGMRIADPHRVRGARLADLTAVLYHYKFLGAFGARVDSTVALNQHWNNSIEYRAYQAALRGDASLTLWRSEARRLAGADRLVDEGLLIVGDRFADHLRRSGASINPRPVRP